MKKIAATRNYRLTKRANELPASFLKELNLLTSEQKKALGNLLMKGGPVDAGASSVQEGFLYDRQGNRTKSDWSHWEADPEKYPADWSESAKSARSAGVLGTEDVTDAPDVPKRHITGHGWNTATRECSPKEYQKWLDNK